MNSLQTRLQGLLDAGRISSFEFNQLAEREILPPDWEVYPGKEASELLTGHLVIAPSSFSQRQNVAFVSSRLQKNLSQIPQWFDYLRAGLRKAKRGRKSVLTMPKTTCDRFLHRASATLRVDVVPVRLLNGFQDDFARKLKAFAQSQSIIVTSAMEHLATSKRLETDDILISLANEIMAIKADTDSGTELRLRHLLEHQSRLRGSENRKSVYVAENCGLIDSSMFETLVDKGAMAWHVWSESRPEAVPVARHPVATAKIQILNELTSDTRNYLYHCTRAPNGPWPEQSENQYLDRLIHGLADSQTPLNSLNRIIRQQKIRATKKLTRSNQPVVSFTESTLKQIQQMRIFRSHLGRWDFEPFGIGIKKETLCRDFGAKPVIYGDDELYPALDQSQQPFFQMNQTVTSTGKTIDWTAEREWRVVGDVTLANINKNDIVVFVSSVEDANRIGNIWRNDIVVFDEATLHETPAGKHPAGNCPLKMAE